MITDEKEIKQFIKDYRSGNGSCRFKNTFPVHKIQNGKIYCRERPVLINHCLLIDNELAIPFAETGQLTIRSEELESLEGFPEIATIGGNKGQGWAIYFERANGKLMSLEHMTPYILGDANFQLLYNMSYSNAHKHIKEIKGYLQIQRNYEGPLLSLLLIKNLKTLYVPLFSGGPLKPASDELKKARLIFNSHLNSDKDVLECQEELIENGLKQFAKL